MWSLFPAVWSASYYCHPCQLWKKWKELQKTCFQCSMEYSIWHQIVTIWSTPPGAFLVSYGVLQDQLHLTIYIAIWSTPYGHFLMPYGVLHVVTISCRMECFILLPSMSIVEEMERAPQDLFSMLYGVLHMALNYYHMEYSIWRFSVAIWSSLQLTLNEHY